MWLKFSQSHTVRTVSKCHMKGSFRCLCVFLNDFTAFLMMSCLLAIKSFDSNLFVFRLWFYDVSDKRLNLSIKEKKKIDFQAVALFRQQVATEADLSQTKAWLSCLFSHCRFSLHKCTVDQVLWVTACGRYTYIFSHIYICNTVQKLYAGEEKML